MFAIPGSKIGQGIYSQKWTNWFGPITLVQRTLSGISVPNNVFWTVPSWDTLVRDDVGAFSFANPTQFIVPGNIRMARFTFYAVWANSNSGARDTTITSGTRANMDCEHDGIGFNESSNTMTTAWLSVVPGDFVECFISQNSGGNLNFSAPGGPGLPAWFMAEWSAN